MNGLSLSHPFFYQLQIAINAGREIIIDMRTEANGDKIAHLNIAYWLSLKIGKITLLETAGGRGALMLSEYELPENIQCVVTDIYSEYDEEDYPGFLLNGKGDKDYLWIINSYLCTQQIRAPFSPKRKEKTDLILFCPLTNSEYNERRDWDIEWSAFAFEKLQNKYGDRVVCIWDKEHPKLPTEKRTLDECVQMIGNARLVIAGDSGFSHCAAAFGTPLVSIYPDWSLGRVDRQGTANRIAEWFDLPVALCRRTYYPNAEFNKWRLVELGQDHKFSVEHLLQAAEKLRYL